MKPLTYVKTTVTGSLMHSSFISYSMTIMNNADESRTIFYMPAFILLLFPSAYLLKLYFSKRNNFPPGPTGLPIVGYLPFLGKEAYLVLHQLRLKYGGVYSLVLGSKRVLVIASYDAMKEAYVKSAFLGRPPNTAFEYFFKMRGIGVTGGDEWVESRRFFMNNLRTFSEKLDSAIEREIKYLLQKVEEMKGKPFNSQRYFTSSISNLIMDFTIDRRFKYDDPTKVLLDDAAEILTQYFGMISYSLYITWLQPLAFLTDLFSSRRHTILASVVKTLEIFDTVFDEYDSQHIKNISDAYVYEMVKGRNEPYSPYTLEGYVGTMASVIGAGFDTVSTSLAWTLITLATCPRIQKRVQEEIDSTFGEDGQPNWEERCRLPYTQAVIMEIQRWRTILPLSGLRYTLSDTKIQGYEIPKGTIVLFNLWGVHNDPKYWDKPEEFRPERFLAEDGTVIAKKRSFAPFSYGKRSCPAEGIAYKEIFLFLTSILQKYNSELPASIKPDLEGITHGGLTLLPKQSTLSLVSRKKT